jgi:hypothetical protein
MRHPGAVKHDGARRTGHEQQMVLHEDALRHVGPPRLVRLLRNDHHERQRSAARKCLPVVSSPPLSEPARGFNAQGALNARTIGECTATRR